VKGARNLTDEEIVNVFNELKTKRDKALFLVGISTGLRVSELLSLTVGDIYKNGQISDWVTVQKKNTKGKSESKTLPIPADIKSFLHDYVKTTMGPEEALFKSTKDNKAISRIQAHKILKKVFGRLEMTGNLSTHCWRKAFAHRTHKAMGNQIEKTRVALGHKNLSSTVSYIEVNKEEVNTVINNVGNDLAGKIFGSMGSGAIVGIG